MPAGTTTYYRISARDTVGNHQEFFAAYHNDDLVLFQMNGKLAQVMYLLKAPRADDIGRVVTERVIDAQKVERLDQRPELEAALLPGPQRWTPMQRGMIGVILETNDIR
jgi:hypothetical protein